MSQPCIDLIIVKHKIRSHPSPDKGDGNHDHGEVDGDSDVKDAICDSRHLTSQAPLGHQFWDQEGHVSWMCHSIQN